MPSKASQCVDSGGIPSGGLWNIQHCDDEHGIQAIEYVSLKQNDVYDITFTVYHEADPVVLLIPDRKKLCRGPIYSTHVRRSVSYLHKPGLCCDIGVSSETVLKCG